MKKPLVSVIITTYNREIYLRECVKSILNQTYHNFEIIVVDNFSNYNIKKLIKSFNDKRLKLLQNHNDGKYVINRNLGINISDGDFIAFWYPENLKTKINYLINNKSIGMVTSKENIIDNNGNNINKTTHPWIKKTKYLTFKNFFFKNAGSPSAAIIRKDCFNQIGYFDESELKKNIEDIDLWIRISLKYNILYLNKILSSFRFHNLNESYLNDSQILNSYRLRKKLFKKNKKEISSFYYEAKFHLLKLKLKLVFFYFKRKEYKKIYRRFTDFLFK